MSAQQIPMSEMEPYKKPNEPVRTPMSIVEWAVDKGATAEQVNALIDAQLRWQANEARLAYVAAMQQFKKTAPDIFKTHKVEYPNSNGSKTSYSHAELDKITPIITEALLAVGINPTWRPSDSNGRIVVTCVLTHELGHAEDAATLSGPADTSGGKNNIQAIGSTTSYLQRYTLLAGTGLAAKGQDDDGKTDGMTEDAITDYCIQMQDASPFMELKKVFEECWRKAQKLNDKQAMDRLRKVYEGRKRELAS